MSKNKDNMTLERWKMLKLKESGRIFADRERNGIVRKRHGKLLWDINQVGTYKKERDGTL